MNAIMSIKKEYSQKILSGEKLYEFRKIAPFKAERIYIYETSPTKWIVGSFEFEAILDDPINLWERFGEFGGIQKSKFFEYYKNYDLGYALKIKDIRVENINPYDILSKFSPPQNYVYFNFSQEKE